MMEQLGQTMAVVQAFIAAIFNHYMEYSRGGHCKFTQIDYINYLPN